MRGMSCDFGRARWSLGRLFTRAGSEQRGKSYGAGAGSEGGENRGARHAASWVVPRKLSTEPWEECRVREGREQVA